MTALTDELAEILCELPEERAREVDFARFLQHQADDAEWERIVADACPRPRLDAFAAEALKEKTSERSI
jgi:hypothetical protein